MEKEKKKYDIDNTFYGFQMARTKQTAKKSGDTLKAPRKQLKSKKTKQKKTADEIELVKTRLRKIRKETALYADALKHYGDDGFELPMPPPIKIPNEDSDTVVMGRPKLAARQCGMCFKVFLSVLGWKNHMPYHHRGCGHKCGFCLEAMKTDKTIKLEDCWFATREAAVKHLARKHEIKIGVLTEGKELEGAFKKKNMSKIQNTKKLQQQLSKVFTLAYELPDDLKFNKLQMKITGDKKYDHPFDYDLVTTVPIDAVQPADVTEYVVQWGDGTSLKLKPGSKKYKKFEESSGCFDLYDLHEERGGTYDSKFLRLLIRAKDFQFGFTRAAFAKCEVATIESEIPEGCVREKVEKYVVEWLGYDERTTENAENLDSCEKEIEKFWKFKELERRMNDPKINETKSKKQTRKSRKKSSKSKQNTNTEDTERVLRATKDVNYRKN